MEETLVLILQYMLDNLVVLVEVEVDILDQAPEEEQELPDREILVDWVVILETLVMLAVVVEVLVPQDNQDQYQTH